MKRLHFLTICTIIIAALIFFYKKKTATTIADGQGLVIKKEWLITNKKPITLAKDVRPADQTFLTFPEWYLVFSPEEHANYFKHTTATSFPYLAHTKQIWESYYIVNEQIKDNFPPNEGYHFMIWVIGTSASIEYLIKSWYETIIGRITDTNEVKTDEDKFNAIYTQNYVDFIKDRPWYEFDFKIQLKNLFENTSFLGSNIFRKLERKYFLTSELIIKWGYGKLIGLGTSQVYDVALPTTTVLTNTNKIVNVSRYDKFNQEINKLAQNDENFKEIAGNNSAILLTILVKANYKEKSDNTQIVFTQPISSDLTMKRIAIATPVKNLSQLLLKLQKQNIKIEHIFDF